MFVKAIATLLLLGFFYVQLGSTLECYSCNTPTGCFSPGKITCTTDHANATTAYLHFYYKQNLTNYASPNFECFHHNYTAVSATTNTTYKGCIYRDISACSLDFKPEYEGLKNRECYKCGGNLCNKNPAGTFSSSVLTMLTSVVVVALFKVLKM